MTDADPALPPSDEHSDEHSDEQADETQQEDVQDDAAISTAMRASLWVLIVLGIPIIGLLVVLNLRKPDAETVQVEMEAPEGRKKNDTVLPVITMTDVTASAGIDFSHYAGKQGEKLLPETMGSGVAVLDYNQDGHQDILFVNSSDWPWNDSPRDPPATCRLFKGNGKFEFTDVTKTANMDVTLYGMGAAVGDYDNDGDQDVFLTAVGHNRLLRNDDGKFIDVSEESGVMGDETTWSTSSGFFDYDNDGRLDLFVCNYVDWSKDNDITQNFTLDGETRAYGPPKAFSGSFSYLYHNEGDGKFADVSETAGIQIRNEDTHVPLGKAMGLAPVDVNQDGWIDIVVSNDTVRNFLFENNQDGTFSENGRLAGIAYDLSGGGNARGAMGIDSAFFREDGTLAIGIGNFANEASALYMISPRRKNFVDAAMYTGFGPPTRLGLTFGLFFFDADLDGRLDVMGANGHLEEEISKTQRTQRYAQPPQLFWNAGREAPSELVLLDQACTGESFCEPIVGRGTAFGDFDEDGDQDVVIAVSDGPAKLLRNDQSTKHHWLRLKLIGTQCNPDAIGAKVTVTIKGVDQMRTVMAVRSYLSQSELPLTFGLGDQDKIDKISVRWPGGDTVELLPEQFETVDRLIEITQ